MRVARELAFVAAAVAGATLFGEAASAKTAVIQDADEGVRVTYYSEGSGLSQYYPVSGYRYSLAPVRDDYGPWRPYGQRYSWGWGYTTYPYTYARYPYGYVPYGGFATLTW